MSPPPPAEPDEVEAVVGRYYIRRTDDNDAEKTLRDGAKSPLNYRNATGALILEAQSGRLAGGCIIMKGINSTKPPKKPLTPKLKAGKTSTDGFINFKLEAEGVSGRLRLKLAA